MRDPIVRLDRFSYDGKTQTLSAEASELPGFSDYIRIAGTDREIGFEHQQTHRDSDNDVTHWEFRAVGAPFTLVIFND